MCGVGRAAAASAAARSVAGDQRDRSDSRFARYTGRAGPTSAERFEDARHLLNKKSLCAAVRSGS